MIISQIRKQFSQVIYVRLFTEDEVIRILLHLLKDSGAPEPSAVCMVALFALASSGEDE